MAEVYKFDRNPFSDYLVSAIIMGYDISDDESMNEIYSAFGGMISTYHGNVNELRYLDFDIVNKDKYFRVMPKNILTALWFVGIFPRDSKKVMDENTFTIDGEKFTFNKKTKRLKIDEIESIEKVELNK